MKKIMYILMLSAIGLPSFAVHIPETMRQSMAHDYGVPGFTQLVLSMILVVGLIYFTGWIYTKLNIVNRKQIGKIAADNDEPIRFKVLQTMPLGQQRHIYTIEMNGKILLVGSTPSHINLIKEFDCKENADVNVKDVINSLNEEDFSSDTNKTSVDINELYKKYKN